MSGRYDFSIEQGADFQRTITWKDENDAPVNLTGATAKMQIRDASDTAIVTLTGGSGLTLGGVAGTIQIDLTAAQTTAMDFGTARYDLEVTISGKVTRLLRGVVGLDREVTL